MKYDIIYCDPPWHYRVWTAKGGDWSASAHYKVMNTEDISSLPVSDIASKNCTLFLWATAPNLIDALNVIKSWGFTFKTIAFTWLKIYNNGKPVCGLGYYTRSSTELCLLATKGKPKRINANVYQAVLEPQRKHSQKPDTVKERIVQLMGDLPRIELFARDVRREQDGWLHLGWEISNKDIRVELREIINNEERK